MTTVLIVIHLMVVLALIGIVLLQRSEGGALGIGGGSGALMSGRGAGNVLTRSTAVLAAVFFITSIGLTLLARIEARPGDILDRLPVGTAPAATPGAGAPATPASNEPPATAADLLKSLGGTAPGPQTPPAAAPAAPLPAAPAPPSSALPTPTTAVPEGTATPPEAPAPPSTGAPKPGAAAVVPAAPSVPAQ